MKLIGKHNKLKYFMGAIALLAIAFIAGSGSLNSAINWLQTNINLKVAKPFDGLVAPIEKVPNWVELSSEQWKLDYTKIPSDNLVDIPKYVPKDLIVNASSIDWNNAEDRKKRNAQITYSVPYMGNYKLDGREYAGSHLAVDIKIPMNTPIKAIGNGIVVKTYNGGGGFGKHIVIKHVDFPDFDNPNKKAVYYSGYAHLNSILVAEGDIVEKGDLIAKSGNSGTSTTPHLHFQIDNDSAPWHMYWPFTSAEAASAGLSFFEAVNSGLGKEKALATTINPMVYIQKHASNESSIVQNYGSTNQQSEKIQESATNKDQNSNESTSEQENSNNNLRNIEKEESPENTEQDEELDELPPIQEEPVNVGTIATPIEVVERLESFDLVHKNNFNKDQELTIRIVAKNQNDEVFEDFKPEQDINVELIEGSGKLSQRRIMSSNFENGIAKITLESDQQDDLKVRVSYKNITVDSEKISAKLFSDLEKSDIAYKAVAFLEENDVVRGYPDGSFRANNPVSRVEALKFIYEGLNKDFRKSVVLEYPDTDSKSWYARYIAAATIDRVINGYPDGTFRPADQVEKAEFLKMLIEAGDFNVNSVNQRIQYYQDVPKKDWYAKYFAFARDRNLIDQRDGIINPGKELTRAEVAEILYRVIVMKAENKSRYDQRLVVDSKNVATFFEEE